MKTNPVFRYILTVLVLAPMILKAQEKHYFQSEFTPAEFSSRRNQIFDAIGPNAIAVIQGAPSVAGFKVFRQSNTFYYLSGLEEGHAYLLLNGKNRTTTLYLPHRDEGREQSQGKILSAEDAELVGQLTGIEQVKPIEFLGNDLVGTGLIKSNAPDLYLPFSPAETGNDSRDEILHGRARAAADPWDHSIGREAHFKQLILDRFPDFNVRNLSPILDKLRVIKSPAEIAVIRKATQIAGLAIMEAMRSTAPGIFEYQLDAAAKYVFYLHGAQGDGYPAIIGGGANAYMGHYFRKTDPLVNGDLVLMDYAPDFRNYTSDVTRIWPVNGTFNPEQKALYEYILAYRDALFRQLRPGVTSDQVLDAAAAEMEAYLKGKTFKNPNHLKAVREGVKFRGHFQHPVGMAVHDVGVVHHIPLEAGMVFTIDPMIWIPEEKAYIRIEDVVVITETGAENLSAFVPSAVAEIEKLIQEKGLTEFLPAQALPLKNKM
ncbi:MAG: hypothetical protein RLZZ241_2293 [Bacteroidota bacterium]|jgi:Xaa-Pro aminopeptidase